MTPATLRQLGLAVWGDLWRAELARAVGRNLDTVRRWGRVGRMSRKDHLRILEAAKLHSKARHKTVLGLVASIKNRPITGCRTYDRRNQVKKAKDPIPPWKNDPQQLVATREFFANHARPEAFHMKPSRHMITKDDCIYPDCRIVVERVAACEHACPYWQEHQQKQTENVAAPQQDSEVTPQMAPQPPSAARPREKTPGWVVEGGGR